LKAVCNVNPHFDEAGVDPTDEQILERAQGCDILITKEIPISAEVISKLPESIKLI
jgi:glycerate dehydrogenase